MGRAKLFFIVFITVCAQAAAVRPAAAVSSLPSCDPVGTLRQLRWDSGTLSRVWLQSCVRTPPGKATAVGVWSLTDRDNSDVQEVDVLTALIRRDGAVLKGGPCYDYSGFPQMPRDAACDVADYLPPTGTLWQCYAHIRVRVYWNNGRGPSTTEFLDSKLVSCPGN
jgi:hypothetical protein